MQISLPTRKQFLRNRASEESTLALSVLYHKLVIKVSLVHHRYIVNAATLERGIN